MIAVYLSTPDKTEKAGTFPGKLILSEESTWHICREDSAPHCVADIQQCNKLQNKAMYSEDTTL